MGSVFEHLPTRLNILICEMSHLSKRTFFDDGHIEPEGFPKYELVKNWLEKYDVSFKNVHLD